MCGSSGLIELPTTFRRQKRAALRANFSSFDGSRLHKRQINTDCCDRVVVYYRQKLSEFETYENFYGLYSKTGEENGHNYFTSHCSVNQAENESKFGLFFCPGSGRIWQGELFWTVDSTNQHQFVKILKRPASIKKS